MGGAWLATIWHLSASTAFSAAHTDATGRRAALLSGALATVAAPVASRAAELPGLGKMRGPFEVDPKDAVIIGDAESSKMKSARAKVISLQEEAEQALASMGNDAQTDLMPMVTKFGIADLRDATNMINDIMDDASAAGTQRLQRLMIQSKYQLEDDIPFPVTRKGKVLPRGEERNNRIIKNLQDYIERSKQLMQFLE